MSSMSRNPVFERFPKAKQRSAFRPRVWFIAGAILVFALPIFGIWRIRFLKRSALAYWEGQLSSVADVTIFAVREWTRERESELRTLATLIDRNPELFEPGTRPVSAAEQNRVRNSLEESLDLIKQQGGYSGVWALDAAGRSVLTSR